MNTHDGIVGGDQSQLKSTEIHSFVLDLSFLCMDEGHLCTDPCPYLLCNCLELSGFGFTMFSIANQCMSLYLKYRDIFSTFSRWLECNQEKPYKGSSLLLQMVLLHLQWLILAVFATFSLLGHSTRHL